MYDPLCSVVLIVGLPDFNYLVLLTLSKWCSLSDVYGRKVLFHIGLAGTAIYICLNLFAASRYNVLGYYLFYLEAVSFALIPASAVLNPAIFAYCGKAKCKVNDMRVKVPIACLPMHFSFPFL